MESFVWLAVMAAFGVFVVGGLVVTVVRGLRKQKGPARRKPGDGIEDQSPDRETE